MHRILLIATFVFLYFCQTQAQDYHKLLPGKWEDVVSNNETSFQFIIEKDTNQLLFAKVAQANIMNRVPRDEEKLYNYTWVRKDIIAYAKIPKKDPVQARLYPSMYTFIRIDEINDNNLKISLADFEVVWSKLDSVIKAGNLDKFFNGRTAEYKKLDLKKEKNKAMLLGLWEDPASNDTVSFQFYIQKGVLAFSKLDSSAQKEPTAIKPNTGYNYKWLNDYVFCYWKQAPTGFVKKDYKQDEYYLMRVELANRKKLIVTLGTRPFNKAGIDYILEENKLHQYFIDNQIIYRRIKLVEEACEGTEIIQIGGKSMVTKKKPIIYLYPQQEQEVNVKVDFVGQFTHTYPKYNRSMGWTVKAYPDGTLIDEKTNKEYYALYWEGENDLPYTTDKGFVIKGEESAAFLEEKCEQLGLSPREANEFIIYWLPELERNPYNFIHFSLAEYQAQAPMNISPKPDALIRVFMLYKGLDEPMLVEEQVLPQKPARKGFTVVEWGGAALDKHFIKLK